MSSSGADAQRLVDSEARLKRPSKPEPLVAASSWFLWTLGLVPVCDKSLLAMQSTRRYATGHIVEKCYALPLKDTDVKGTFLERRCFDPKDKMSPNLRLLPLGFGLMYNHDPRKTGTLEVKHSVDSSGSHWLTFYATKDLNPDEELTVRWDMGDRESDEWDCMPVLQAAFQWAEPEDFSWPGWGFESSFEFFQQIFHSRKVTGQLQFDPDCPGHVPLKVGYSEIHGLGVFSCDAVKKGTLMLVCPVLLLRRAEILGKLGDYIFKGESEETWWLPLGLAAIINHSIPKSNLAWWVSVQSPFLMLWVASRNIQAGEELFFDYGEMYWTGTDRIIENYDGLEDDWCHRFRTAEF